MARCDPSSAVGSRSAALRYWKAGDSSSRRVLAGQSSTLWRCHAELRRTRQHSPYGHVLDPRTPRSRPAARMSSHHERSPAQKLNNLRVLMAARTASRAWLKSSALDTSAIEPWTAASRMLWTVVSMKLSGDSAGGVARTGMGPRTPIAGTRGPCYLPTSCPVLRASRSVSGSVPAVGSPSNGRADAPRRARNLTTPRTESITCWPHAGSLARERAT